MYWNITLVHVTGLAKLPACVGVACFLSSLTITEEEKGGGEGETTKDLLVAFTKTD